MGKLILEIRNQCFVTTRKFSEILIFMKGSKKIIMKRFIYALLICVLCFSFSGKNEDLVIEILNTEILSRGNILDKDIRDVTRFDNYIYPNGLQ